MCLLEAKNPTQNPEIPKQHRVQANFFKKFARTFAFFPVTRVRNPTKLFRTTSSDELLHVGWIFSGGLSSCDFFLPELFLVTLSGATRSGTSRGAHRDLFGNSLGGSAGIVWEVYRGSWLRIWCGFRCADSLSQRFGSGFWCGFSKSFNGCANFGANF